MSYKQHIESGARSVGVFLTVFFSARWAKASKPKYDYVLLSIAALLAVILANVLP